jgi:tetratricopeptide (TPR) repeat protein
MEHFKKGKRHYQEGKYEEAISEMTLCLKENPPNSLYTYIFRGLAHQALNHKEEAIQDYSEVIRTKPEDSWLAYNNRGTVR